MRFLLVGNPNVGKSALFNVLTEGGAHVGNFPGVTVEKREGMLRAEWVKPKPVGGSGSRVSRRTKPRRATWTCFSCGETACPESVTCFSAPTLGGNKSLSRVEKCFGGCSFPPSDRGDSHCFLYSFPTGNRDSCRKGTGSTQRSETAIHPGTPVPSVGTHRPDSPSRDSRGASGGGEEHPSQRNRFGDSRGVRLFSFLRGVPDTSSCVSVLDLPGVYSLRTFSEEERVAIREIMNGGEDGTGDVVINVADAVCPARSLYLTLQLTGLGVPAVLALNRMDELRAGGGNVDATALSRRLGIPVIPVSARTGEGIRELAQAALSVARSVKHTPHTVRYTAVPPMTLSSATASSATVSFVSTSPASRYREVDRLCRETFAPPRENPVRRRTVAVDRFLLVGRGAYPALLLAVATVFLFTFPLAGRTLQALAERLFSMIAFSLDGALSALDSSLAGTAAGAVTPVLHRFLTDGVCRGIGSVVSFLPVILLLFFFLSVLEDSGYLARIAFLLDRPLRRFGLSGRSAVPFLLGCGCTVPALLAVRTLPGATDRRRTSFFLPFVSCSAKIPVYLFVAPMLFPHAPWSALPLLYLFGLAVGALCLTVPRLFSRRNSAGEEPFLLELPDYRLPSVRQVFRLMREKTADFLGRAFSVILLASAAVWFLSSFTSSFCPTSDADASLLAAVSRRLVPLFSLIGVTDWRAVAALLSGLCAKEAVVSALSSLGATPGTLFASPASAAAFLTFVLLYPPCAAATACARRECGGGVAALRYLFRFGLAFAVSATVAAVLPH